jgi:hypothetical protein
VVPYSFIIWEIYNRPVSGRISGTCSQPIDLNNNNNIKKYFYFHHSFLKCALQLVFSPNACSALIKCNIMKTLYIFTAEGLSFNHFDEEKCETQPIRNLRFDRWSLFIASWSRQEIKILPTFHTNLPSYVDFNSEMCWHEPYLEQLRIIKVIANRSL